MTTDTSALEALRERVSWLDLRTFGGITLGMMLGDVLYGLLASDWSIDFPLGCLAIIAYALLSTGKDTMTDVGGE